MMVAVLLQAIIKWDIVLFGPSFKLNKFKNIHERLNTSIFKKIFLNNSGQERPFIGNRFGDM